MKERLILRVTTGCILPISFSILLPWIKLHYLKNLKLFSIRVKELFQPIVFLGGGGKRRVFALFKSIFLRNRSLSNARWGDFTVKNASLEREISI